MKKIFIIPVIILCGFISAQAQLEKESNRFIQTEMFPTLETNPKSIRGVGRGSRFNFKVIKPNISPYGKSIGYEIMEGRNDPEFGNF